MTALVTALGLLPLAMGSGDPGREIEGPMAIVILGGLLTSTVLSLFVLPTLALRFGRFGGRRPNGRSERGLAQAAIPAPAGSVRSKTRPSQRSSTSGLRRRSQQQHHGRPARPPTTPAPSRAASNRAARERARQRQRHGEHRRVRHDHQHVLAQRLDASRPAAPRGAPRPGTAGRRRSGSACPGS